MKLKISNKFLKDVRNIDDFLILEQVNSFLKDVEKLSLKELFQKYKIKKIVWFKGFYRVKFHNYRLWFKINQDVIFILRLLHRKDIYKFFP